MDEYVRNSVEQYVREVVGYNWEYGVVRVEGDGDDRSYSSSVRQEGVYNNECKDQKMFKNDNFNNYLE